MKGLIYILSFVSLLPLLSCSETPAGVIEPHEMARLLIDIHKSESVIELNRRDYRDDSIKMAIEEAVYSRHKIDKEQFDSSLSWYGHHIEEYMKVYDEVIEQLQYDIEQTEAIASKVQMIAIGDSADTWSSSSRITINGYSPQKDLFMELFQDETWEKGDNYTMNLKLINSLSPIKIVLGVEYEDGQLEWIENSLNDPGKYSFTFISDSTKTMRKVFGLMDIEPQNMETIFLDSISVMRTRSNRENYSRRYSQKKLIPKINSNILPDSTE